MKENKVILHVEDSFENRILIRRLLQFEGYDVLEADSASQALKILENSLPDLILMDMNMPDMDGFTLTTKIKADPKLKRIPVVAITANVMRGDRERSLNAGCDGYIEKPIDVDKFTSQVGKYLDRN
jgi:two-component system cell cycle response regulator DivK